MIIQCMFNEITKKNGYPRFLCKRYALNSFLCTITLPDRGIPFSKNRGTLPDRGIHFSKNRGIPKEMGEKGVNEKWGKGRGKGRGVGE